MNNILDKFSKENPSPEEQAEMTKEMTLLIHKKVPAFLAFLITLVFGSSLFTVIQSFFEDSLQNIFKNDIVIFIVMLVISFGPLFYIEEKIEKVIARLISYFYFKKYPDELIIQAIEDSKKSHLS